MEYFHDGRHNTTHISKMPREAEPSLNEKQFVLQALQENLRLDGRELDQYRPLELEFGDQYGVANVTLGKTKYVDAFLPQGFCFF